MSARNAIKNLLLGFVLVSIGFALGKEFALRSIRTTQAGDPAPAAIGDKTIVYYVHGTIRCVTCNKIEKLAHETIQREFAEDLRAGRIEWRTMNFQEHEDLAQRYDIASSTLVLVKLTQGKEVGFKKLDEVWTLADNPAAFSAYVTGAIGSCLGGGPQ